MLRRIAIATADNILDAYGQHGHFIYYTGQYCIPPILYYKGDEFWDACTKSFINKTFNLRIKGISLVQYFRRKSLILLIKKGESLSIFYKERRVFSKKQKVTPNFCKRKGESPLNVHLFLAQGLLRNKSINTQEWKRANTLRGRFNPMLVLFFI